MELTFAQKVNRFNTNIHFTGSLPKGITMMNPFRESEAVRDLSSAFYLKYYNDYRTRRLILGINPGRFGGGVTGIPFTDTKRLVEKCHLPYTGKTTHEPSSVFIYEMIDAYGGPEAFYSEFYITSICPLGFIATGTNGREVNHNYYDSRELMNSVYEFMVESMEEQLGFGINTDVCYCFGKGKNEKFLRSLNEKKHFFENIIALEHPRYIMQYKSRSRQFYIDKYLSAFG